MEVKSFGCSFVWGSEMSDAGIYFSRKSWPALVAQHLNLPYDCMARPGCGNLYIAEQILNYVSLPGAEDHLIQPTFFIINWTYIDRFDYLNYTNDQWETLRPGGRKDSLKDIDNFYYKNLHSQYRDKLTTLMHIKLCIDALQQAGHPFLMTYMDNLLFETKWHVCPAMRKLQAAICKHLKTFDGKNMVEYSRSLGHKISANEHPLENAHQDLFKYAVANFEIKT